MCKVVFWFQVVGFRKERGVTEDGFYKSQLEGPEKRFSRNQRCTNLGRRIKDDSSQSGSVRHDVFPRFVLDETLDSEVGQTVAQ